MSKRLKRAKKAKDPRPTKVSSRRITWVAIALGCLTGGLFLRTAGFPFTNFDDPAYVFERPQIARGFSLEGVIWSFTHVHSGNWHPLTSLSHMLDCQFFGLNAGSHHLVNVLLHTGAVVLLFLVLTRMTGSLWPSAFVSAVFGIHPLRVESVAWIAERKDVLSAVFFMLTLLAYIRYVRAPSRGKYCVVGILFALGLMAKPMLVTLPFVLLLLDYWPLNRWILGNLGKVGVRTLPELILEKAPLLALSAASSAATLFAQTEALSTAEQLPFVPRIANAVANYLIYIWKMIWPVDLALLYPYPSSISAASVAGATLLLIAITILVFLARRRAPYLLTGWLWYLGMLVPTIGLVHVGRQAYADRYTYLPQIGLYIMVAWGAAQLTKTWSSRQTILTAATVAIIAALTGITWAQLSYWRDAEPLWQHTIAVTQNNYIAHAFLADLLMRKNRVADSLAQAEEAVRIQPNNADAQNDLALALFRSGRAREAAEHWRRCLQLAPTDMNAECNYAWLLSTAPDATLRDGPRAVQLTQDVLNRYGRDNPLVLRGAGAAMAESERFPEAITLAEQALQLARDQQNAPLIEDLSLNLATYRRQRPLRDPGMSASH